MDKHCDSPSTKKYWGILGNMSTNERKPTGLIARHHRLRIVAFAFILRRLRVRTPVGYPGVDPSSAN